jgi:hypothetical protein
MAIGTYIIVEGHYLSELLIFGTVQLNAGFLSPFIVGSRSTVLPFEILVSECHLPIVM